MERIKLTVKLNSEGILKQFQIAREKAKELNIELIKLEEIITNTCEVTEEKPEE